jgi:hypothetical protein
MLVRGALLAVHQHHAQPFLREGMRRQRGQRDGNAKRLQGSHDPVSLALPARGYAMLALLSPSLVSYGPPRRKEMK